MAVVGGMGGGDSLYVGESVVLGSTSTACVVVVSIPYCAGADSVDQTCTKTQIGLDLM